MLINKLRKWKLITILYFEKHLSIFLINDIHILLNIRNIIYTI